MNECHFIRVMIKVEWMNVILFDIKVECDDY